MSREEEPENMDISGFDVGMELEIEIQEEIQIEVKEEVKEESLSDESIAPEEPLSDESTAPEEPENNMSLELEVESEEPPASPESVISEPSSANAESAPPPEEGKGVKRIGDQLVEQGIISEDQLKVAIHEKQQSGKMMGEILVDLGFIAPEILSTFLSKKTGYEEFNPSATFIDPEALEYMSKTDATKLQSLPISITDDTVFVAMADPYDVMALDRLRQIFPKNVEIDPLVCTPAVLSEAIDNAYGHASSIEAILQELAGEEISNLDVDELSEEEAYSHPIVRLVNALVFDAVKLGVSDIHFEPEQNFVRVRYRKDGVLKSVQTLHKEYWTGMAQRLKIMSGMNIADKLMPQDGRFGMSVGGREADFRVSSLPTVNGENIVLRILDQSSGLMPLADLGFSPHNLELINKSLSRPEGIIIVTGPTGSGKTTSLYSMLSTVNTIDVNIQTLEDPVEYSLPMIRQTHVKEGMGLTFAEGIKSLLRQDPDIIFIGEVRDEVTAEQALKAAMTGHQVFTTLHTNDSFGAIPRLLDLKLKPGMLAGAIIAVFAQRLVRRLCDCKESALATEEECKLLDFDIENPPEIYHKVGCSKCEKTGYKGRVAVAEVLFMNEVLDEVIAGDGTKIDLKNAAREQGFKSMADDGVIKILDGLTSIEAVMKVVNFTDRM